MGLVVDLLEKCKNRHVFMLEKCKKYSYFVLEKCIFLHLFLCVSVKYANFAIETIFCTLLFDVEL